MKHIAVFFASWTVIAGCTSAPPSPPPRIVGNVDTPVLLCWFVVHDDLGRSGYAGWDGRLGHVEPAGGGLFPTLEAFRAAMLRSGITNASIEPSYTGAVPAGWDIRGLTLDEIGRLR